MVLCRFDLRCHVQKSVPNTNDSCYSEDDADVTTLNHNEKTFTDYRCSSASSLHKQIATEQMEKRLQDLHEKCTCGISAPYLPPVGQMLTILRENHISSSSCLKPTEDISTESNNYGSTRTCILPLDFMNKSDKAKYMNVRKGILCWWCKHDFDWDPVGCPVRCQTYRDTIQKNERIVSYENGKRVLEYIPRARPYGRIRYFHLFGYFCTYSCARAYANAMLPNSIKKDVPINLHLLLKEVVKHLIESGKIRKDTIVKIPKAAPNFTFLQAFGGPYTITQFRFAPELDNQRELNITPEWMPYTVWGLRAVDSVTDNKTPNFYHNRNCAHQEAEQGKMRSFYQEHHLRKENALNRCKNQRQQQYNHPQTTARPSTISYSKKRPVKQQKRKFQQNTSFAGMVKRKNIEAVKNYQLIKNKRRKINAIQACLHETE